MCGGIMVLFYLFATLPYHSAYALCSYTAATQSQIEFNCLWSATMSKSKVAVWLIYWQNLLHLHSCTNIIIKTGSQMKAPWHRIAMLSRHLTWYWRNLSFYLCVCWFISSLYWAHIGREIQTSIRSFYKHRLSHIINKLLSKYDEILRLDTTD